MKKKKGFQTTEWIPEWSHSLYDKDQSGLCSNQGIETVIKVINDLKINSDSQRVSALVFLISLLPSQYWSWHSNSKISWLTWFNQPDFDWLLLYLKGRHFYVLVSSFISAQIKIQSGVPQRSVLRPLLFNLHMLLLGGSIKKPFISYHSTQMTHSWAYHFPLMI